MKDFIACMSYGKDSIVIPELCKRHNLPLTRIVHVEIMATDTVPAQLPEMTEFKKHANDVIEDRYGIAVETIHPEYTFEKEFYRVIKSNKSKRSGQIYGFPLTVAPYCVSDIKVRTLRQLYTGGALLCGTVSR